MGLKIGELARVVGTTAPAIRYYEDIGLLPRPHRVGSQRRYSEDDVRRLTFIRRCRGFGFSIEQVQTREKLVELHALEDTISGFIEAADDVCRGGSGADCVVLEDLSKPAAPYSG